MQVSAVIAAGGSGSRLGKATPKQFLDLNGRPVMAWCLDSFSTAMEIGEIIVVAPIDYLNLAKEITDKYCKDKPWKVVHGGSTRHESVKNGVSASSSKMEWVAVHDAARPFIRPDEIDAICLLARELGAAILAKKVIDTIKEIKDDIITRTLDRSMLAAALTPQVCKKADLLSAYSHAEAIGFVATDEASLLEEIGIDVAVQFGSPINFKITTEEDLTIARAISSYFLKEGNGL